MAVRKVLETVAIFLKIASQDRNPFVQQHTTCNARYFTNFSYNGNKNGEQATPGKLKFYTREE